MPISINKASFYACPLLIDGQAFDCRIFLNEQIMWKQVVENPVEGKPINGANNDPRFPIEAGFQKMAVNHKLSDGTKIEIHYQYNSITDKAYDVKIETYGK